MRKYDIAIAGGAMAGATFALALDNLSNGQLSIAVIEPYQISNELHPGFDSRAIALSYGTKLILEKCGLWSYIKPLAIGITDIHVSDRGHAGMTDINKSTYGIEALGYVVELADIGLLYRDLVSRSKNIDFLCPDSVQDISRSLESTTIKLNSGKEIVCQLLVAADGAQSVCGQLLGHTDYEYDFNQVAVITNIEVSEAHKGRAFERFTPSGPLALLPMSNNRMSVVWCLEPDKAEQTLCLSEQALIEALQQAFGWRLGKIVKVGEVASYPLILKRKEQIISHRFVAVGNAAQLLHPIAGQGFNLGIRDIASLIDKIIGQHDVGDYSLLKHYRQCREYDRSQTLDLTAGMAHIFSNEWFPLLLGRNIALMFMDNIPLLKEPLLQRTMGLVER